MTFSEVLGCLVLLLIVLNILRSIVYGIFQTFVAPILGLGVNWKTLGKWAVVTGATDGIGKAYAEQIAKKGFNIVLISRTQEKLNTVAEEIAKKYGVKTKTVSVDFTSLEIYEEIRKQVEGLDIGVLVNNVGMSYEYPEYFTIIPEGDKLVKDIINANALSCTMMMRMILPGMEKRGNGVVINVSSLSALSSMPLLVIYGATKAYMDYLSKGLQVEYMKSNIIIQSVLPGFVATKMAKLRRATTIAPYPNDYVRWALKTVGIETQTFGYPVHKLVGYAMEVLEKYTPWLSSILVSKQLGALRSSYYKKMKLVDPRNKNSKNK